MENKNTTINYIMSHSKLPEIIFKNYKEFLNIATKGQAILSSYLENVWNQIKKDLKEQTTLEVLDKDLKVDLYSFQIAIINTTSKKSMLNITMPPLRTYTEARFITIILETKPRYYTCELSKSFNKENPEDYYILGEWQYDRKKDKFNHIDHGKIEKFTLGKYFEEITRISK